MDILLIETFLSVVHNRNITQAANQLHVTQSTVSSRISHLEDELGVTLISRSKGFRSIELTESGEAFLPVAERYLSLDREIAEFNLFPHAYSLNVAIPDSLNIVIMAPLYEKMLADTPPLHLKISTHHSPEIYSLVENHEADIGFVFYPSRYSNVITKTIFNEEMYIITSKKLGVEKDFLHPSELSVADEFFFTWNENISQWHDYWWQTSSTAIAQVDTVEVLIRLIGSRPSWALCPVSVVNQYKSRGLFRVHSSLVPIPPRTTYMVSRRDSDGAEKIRLFEQYLFEYLRSLGLLDLTKLVDDPRQARI